MAGGARGRAAPAGRGGGRVLRARARQDAPASGAPTAPPCLHSPRSAPSPRNDPDPTNPSLRRRKPRGRGQPCPRYLRVAHAAAVTTIAACPVPFLVIATVASEQLTLTNNN